MNDNQKILVCIVVICCIVALIFSMIYAHKPTYSYRLTKGYRFSYIQQGWTFYEITGKSNCNDFLSSKFIVLYKPGVEDSIPISPWFTKINTEYCNFGIGDIVAVYPLGGRR